jgi:hypothetical protein
MSWLCKIGFHKWEIFTAEQCPEIYSRSSHTFRGRLMFGAYRALTLRAEPAARLSASRFGHG